MFAHFFEWINIYTPSCIVFSFQSSNGLVLNSSSKKIMTLVNCNLRAIRFCSWALLFICTHWISVPIECCIGGRKFHNKCLPFGNILCYRIDFTWHFTDFSEREVRYSTRHKGGGLIRSKRIINCTYKVIRDEEELQISYYSVVARSTVMIFEYNY